MSLDFKKLDKDDLRDLARNITTGVFAQTVVDLGYNHANIKRMFFDKEIDEQQMSDMQEKIDAVYCDHVIKLPSNCLELIIYAHKQGAVRRASRTIDAITTELLERELHEREGKD